MHYVGWDMILAGWRWVEHYFGWVGVGGDEWGWVHCLIMSILSGKLILIRNTFFIFSQRCN